jgi:thioredoxin 1
VATRTPTSDHTVAKPTRTTDGRFAFDVLRQDGPVLVDFYASWCPSCQHLEPVLDELAHEWAGVVKIVKLDVERNPATADRYGVRGIPTLILFDGGVEQHRLVNIVKRQRIEDELGNHLVAPLGLGDAPAQGRRSPSSLFRR